MANRAAVPVTYGLDPSTPRWSLARYQRMIEVGILTPSDKVELLENYIVLRSPRSPRHDGTQSLVMWALHATLPPAWRFRVLGSIVFEDSQPEPDFSVIRGDERRFIDRYPGAADVGLLIEMADASLERDQLDKTRIYARGGVPCYWIINLVDHRVEVYTLPSGPTAAPAYGSVQFFHPGDSVPLVLDGNTVGTIPAADLLP
jgi:Uma2 family endonuclease